MKVFCDTARIFVFAGVLLCGKNASTASILRYCENTWIYKDSTVRILAFSRIL
jgi:hypothetical protein